MQKEQFTENTRRKSGYKANWKWILTAEMPSVSDCLELRKAVLNRNSLSIQLWLQIVVTMEEWAHDWHSPFRVTERWRYHHTLQDVTWWIIEVAFSFRLQRLFPCRDLVRNKQKRMPHQKCSILFFKKAFGFYFLHLAVRLQSALIWGCTTG